MRPPDHYVRLLTNMDPLLSIRWGPYVQQWVIERKGIFGLEERTYLKNRRERLRRKVQQNDGVTKDDINTYTGVCEEHDSAVNGKRVVLIVPNLDRQVYDALCLGDLQRYGGYSRYADEIERQEEEEDTRKQRKISNQNENIAKECFGRLGIYDFLMRHKVGEMSQKTKSIRQLLGLTRDPMEGA